MGRKFRGLRVEGVRWGWGCGGGGYMVGGGLCVGWGKWGESRGYVW